MHKKVKYIRTSSATHMVGDGFRVQPFVARDMWLDLSPFLLLDYFAPWQLMPTQHPRGVGVHPHRGFETVTILWQGALAHEDSTGGKGTLFPGDVQWMTAGSGILHKEFHEAAFSATGGILHGAQLWVNLPAAHKNHPPRYQELQAANIPVVLLDEGRVKARIIAGTLGTAASPVETFTRINLYDLNAQPGSNCTISLPNGDNAALLVLNGTVQLNNETVVRSGEIAVLQQNGTMVEIEANNEAHLLLLSGQPIEEPIAAYGPFVMNTQQEIHQAVDDYNRGTFGILK